MFSLHSLKRRLQDSAEVKIKLEHYSSVASTQHPPSDDGAQGVLQTCSPAFAIPGPSYDLGTKMVAAPTPVEIKRTQATTSVTAPDENMGLAASSPASLSTSQVRSEGNGPEVTHTLLPRPEMDCPAEAGAVRKEKGKGTHTEVKSTTSEKSLDVEICPQKSTKLETKIQESVVVPEDKADVPKPMEVDASAEGREGKLTDPKTNKFSQSDPQSRTAETTAHTSPSSKPPTNSLKKLQAANKTPVTSVKPSVQQRSDLESTAQGPEAKRDALQKTTADTFSSKPPTDQPQRSQATLKTPQTSVKALSQVQLSTQRLETKTGSSTEAALKPKETQTKQKGTVESKRFSRHVSDGVIPFRGLAFIFMSLFQMFLGHCIFL